MKNKTPFKKTSFLLVMALFMLQVSPVLANSAVNERSGGGTGEGNDDNEDGTRGDPVDTKTGNNFFTEVDFSFNTPDVPLSFSREYNSIATYKGPLGVGWSHSLDWRLHEAREIICTINSTPTNTNFKVNLWEGTEILANTTGEIKKAADLTIVPIFLFGSPIKLPVDAYVKQPGNDYYIDLNDSPVSGAIGSTNPTPIVSVQDMQGEDLSCDISYQTNTWMEVYEASGNTTRFWDDDKDGVWRALDSTVSLKKVNADWVMTFPGKVHRVFDANGRMIRYQNGWGLGWSFGYDATGKLITSTHDNGQAISFSYTGNLLHGISAGTDIQIAFNYSNNQLAGVSRSVNGETHLRSYEYTDGILVKKTNPANHLYHFVYKKDGNNHLTPRCFYLMAL